MPRATLRPVLAAGLLALAAASPAGAQRAAPPLSALRADEAGPVPAPYVPALQESGRYGSDATLALGGVAGGALGALGGAAAGFALETTLTGCEGDEFCGFGGILLGGAVGEMVMLPLGVHMANRSRGRYAPSLGMSFAVMLAGFTIASQAGEAAGVVVAAIPITQLVAAIAVERGTAARKLREIDRDQPAT